MTLQEVKDLAGKGEGLQIEFKKKAAYPEKIVREVIALANTQGGTLLIGVDDDGTVSGQRFIEEEIFVMDKAIRTLIFPPLQVEVATVKLSEKKGWLYFKFPIARTGHIICGLRRRKFPTSVFKIEPSRLAERSGSCFEKVEFL